MHTGFGSGLGKFTSFPSKFTGEQMAFIKRKTPLLI